MIATNHSFHSTFGKVIGCWHSNGQKHQEPKMKSSLAGTPNSSETNEDRFAPKGIRRSSVQLHGLKIQKISWQMFLESCCLHALLLSRPSHQSLWFYFWAVPPSRSVQAQVADSGASTATEELCPDDLCPAAPRLQSAARDLEQQSGYTIVDIAGFPPPACSTEDFVGCWLDSNGNTIHVMPSRASNSWLAWGLSTALHGTHHSCDSLYLSLRERCMKNYKHDKHVLNMYWNERKHALITENYSK